MSGELLKDNQVFIITTVDRTNIDESNVLRFSSTFSITQLSVSEITNLVDRNLVAFTMSIGKSSDSDECIVGPTSSINTGIFKSEGGQMKLIGSRRKTLVNNSPVGRFRPWPIRLALARGRITLPREARVEAREMRQPEN